MLLLVIFSFFLFLGVSKPVMALELNSKALIEPHGPIPKAAGPMIDSLDIMDKINADVAIWPCIESLMGYALTMGEGNSILAVVMLSVFAIGLTCADMIVLVVASWNLPSDVKTNEHEVACSKPYQSSAMQVAKVLGKLSMLDVAVMGVLVICLATGMYAKMGVVFYLKSGVVFLLVAEVVHYTAYAIVAGAVERAEYRGEGAVQES